MTAEIAIAAFGIALLARVAWETHSYSRTTREDPTVVCIDSTLYPTTGRQVQGAPRRPPIT